ncbi:MAG: hypothetical protein MUP16_00445, partial [Sedimentisphaerales bacterium]|nr:hypothetical protein [Sedimentisphaerales bacterium]
MLDTVRRGLNYSQRRHLESFGKRINKFGVNFAVCDADDKVILLCESDGFKSSHEQLIEYSRQTLSQNCSKDSPDQMDPPVRRFGNSGQVLTVVLKSAAGRNKHADAVTVALIDAGDVAGKNVALPHADYLAEML